MPGPLREAERRLEPEESREPIRARGVERVSRIGKAKVRVGQTADQRVARDRLLVGDIKNLSLGADLERPPRLEHRFQRKVELVEAGQPRGAALRVEVRVGVAVDREGPLLLVW